MDKLVLHHIKILVKYCTSRNNYYLHFEKQKTIKMKNKNSFSVAELCPAQSLWKNYLIIFSLLLLGLSFNSCKKDLLVPKTVTIDDSNSKIKTISYSEFLSSINLDKTGPLKTTLSSAQKIAKEL